MSPPGPAPPASPTRRQPRQERSLCPRTSRSSWRDRGQDADVPWSLGPMPRRSRCSRGRASSGRSRVSLFRPRPTTRAVPLHHQRPALAKHRVLAKGEGRDARAIFGSALTEEVERLAITGGPVQRGDTVVHLSRHHPAIHDRLRIQPLRHVKDFARTGQVYNPWPGGYPSTRPRWRITRSQSSTTRSASRRSRKLDGLAERVVNDAVKAHGSEL